MREDLKLRIANNIGNMTRGELSSVLDLVSQYEDAVAVGKAKTKFIDYVKYMWPGFIMGAHHKTFADIFERVLSGELKRVIINLPPRHSKSEFCSWLLPSYYLGRFPDKKLMQLSHTGELARSFGRKVRNTIDSQRYQNVFGGVSLRADSKSAGRWNTSKDGVYFANGVGGAVTGRGADLMIIDDPHSEQDAFSASATVYDNAYEWYTSGPRQRLQPGGSIILCMTRWHKRDMTGRLIKDSIERDGDVWEVVELPAILDTGVPLWPEFWSLEELLKLKAELPAQKWAAQYMQAPSKEEGALVKRAWWNLWEGGPPKISYIIMSIDTAYTKKTINDPSALTVWGVFTIDDDDGKSTENIILLDAHEMWEEFPDFEKEDVSVVQGVEARFVLNRRQSIRSSSGARVLEQWEYRYRLGLP